jgi:DNA-binding transcriptional LysR family regulator
MLSLHQLHVFHVAGQSNTLQEAAERLFITQPAVSQQIKRLETQLGTRLFERSRRGIELTPAGRELMTYTTQILRLVAQAESALTNVNNIESGQASIGATPNISSYLLPQWMQSFRTRYTHLTLSIQTAVTPQIIEGVMDRRLELGFVEGEIVTETHPMLGHIVLEAIPHMVIVGKEHSWWGRDAVPMDDLDGQAFVMRQRGSQSRAWLESLFRQFGVSPRITGEFDNPETLKQAVRTGNFMTVLPEQAVQQEIRLGYLWGVRLQDANLNRPMRMTWNREVVLSPVSRALVQHLAQHYPQVLTIFDGAVEEQE